MSICVVIKLFVMLFHKITSGPDGISSLPRYCETPAGSRGSQTMTAGLCKFPDWESWKFGHGHFQPPRVDVVVELYVQMITTINVENFISERP